MTRGKYAARAATRRYETDMATTTETYQRQIVKLAAERDELKAKLAQEQREHAEEVRSLRAMAAEGCAPELFALRRELKAERDQKATIDKVARIGLVRNDQFIRVACRYVSMTTGKEPATALLQVMTWLTDEDEPDRITNPTALVVRLGVTPNGWVARTLRQIATVDRRIKAPKRDRHVSLDNAEQAEYPSIHSLYRQNGKRWYPPISYEGIEAVDRDDSA